MEIKMHLSKHQLLLIFTPLLLSGVLYFISDMLIQNMHYLYPNYQEFQAKSLNNKTQIYLNLATKKTLFYTMKENIKTRQGATTWLSDTILYQKPEQDQELQSLKNNLTSKIQSQVKALPVLRVEAIFPKHNMVIINGKILHLGAYINDAKIMQIKNDSVLLKQKKGLKWVYIFK